MCYFYKRFLQSISKYFVFQIIYLATYLTISNTQSNSNSGQIGDSVLTEQCGFLTINSLNPEVNVSLREGVKIPHALFLNVANKLENASLHVSTGCRVEICGVGTRTNTADDYGVCSTFWRSVTNLSAPDRPYNDLYDMTSLSCACDKKRVGCENSACAHDFLLYDDCGILYQEINCQNCYYNPIRLKDRDAFSTDDSAAVRSVVVRPGCWITMKTKGALWIDTSYDFTYKKNENYLNPTFHVALGGEEFFCQCPSSAFTSRNTLLSSNTEPSTINSPTKGSINVTKSVVPSDSNQKSGDSDTDWIITTGSLSAVIIVIGIGVFIFRRHYTHYTCRQNNPDGPPMLSEDIIRQFKTGGEALTQNDIGVAALSEGHSNALVLPYDPKFEISRTRFIIDVRNILGQGNFGIVYKGRLKVSEDPTNFEYIDVAIKTVKPFATAEYVKPLLNEIKVISYIGHHPNIVCFLGACTWNLRNGDVFNLMEFCGKGSLREYLEELKPVQEIRIGLELNDMGYAKCDVDAATQQNGYGK